MTYTEFKHRILDGIIAGMPEGTAVELKKVPKNNGDTPEGVSIMIPGANFAPMVYLEPCYERYRCGETCAALLEEILRIPEEYGIAHIDTEQMFDPEYILPLLRVRAVNYAWNEEILADRPHRRILDLALVCWWTPDIDGLRDGMITVCRDDLEDLGIGEEEMIDRAIRQTEEAEPLRFLSLREVTEASCGSGDPPEFEILTKERGLFGAVTLFYPSAAQALKERFRTDLFVLPSSVHEMLLLPVRYGASPQELAKMVYEINRMAVAPDEMLSDRVYRFDRETGEIRVAG